jgi:hypothetical protein
MNLLLSRQACKSLHHSQSRKRASLKSIRFSQKKVGYFSNRSCINWGLKRELPTYKHKNHYIIHISRSPFLFCFVITPSSVTRCRRTSENLNMSLLFPCKRINHCPFSFKNHFFILFCDNPILQS